MIDKEEEFIEMEPGPGGTYHPVAVVKMKNNSRSMQGIPPGIPGKTGAFLQIIDGFVLGLGAIENFMINVRRFNKRRER